MIKKTIVCTVCGEKSEIAFTYKNSEQTVCYSCFQIEKDRIRKEYFDELDKLKLTERVRLLEEWVYNYKPYSPFGGF